MKLKMILLLMATMMLTSVFGQDQAINVVVPAIARGDR